MGGKTIYIITTYLPEEPQGNKMFTHILDSAPYFMGNSFIMIDEKGKKMIKEKKTRLIPFDYEKYKAGSRPVTNENFEVLFLYRSEDNYLHGLVRDKNNGDISYYLWDLKGRILEANKENLFLEEELEEKTFYVNVYTDGVGTTVYDRIEEAHDNQRDCGKCLGILKVTYTEEDLIK